MNCRRCGSEMREGIAMGQTYGGTPDFSGYNRVVTLSPAGPGVVIDCLKCPSCGHSISTIGKQGEDV